jgi:lactate permease
MNIFALKNSGFMNSENIIYLFLSLIPILSLVILSLLLSVRKAAIITLVLTAMLFFLWEAPVNNFLASFITSLSSTIVILMIITGAIFLYDVMDKAGLIKEIGTSLNGIHPSEELKFFLLSISLTAFFEGVAGFGTPGAIVPLLLISLGFNPYFSVSAVLLFNGLFAVYGAVGIPLYAGLIMPLGLSEGEITIIERLSPAFTGGAGYLVLWFVMKLYDKFHSPMKYKAKVFLLYTFLAVPFVVFSFFAAELTTILAALSMMVLSVLYLYKGGEKINLKSWIPYAGLIILMLLPKIIPPLADVLSTAFTINNIFGTDISVSIRPFQSPLFPFIIIGLLVMIRYKESKPDLGELFLKLTAVFIVLYPTIVISQMMLLSGSVRPSMVNHIAIIFSLMGDIYIVFAPFIGISGAFITGSTTVSNIIFGASQLETARTLNLNTSLILSLQHGGASIGNAICLFNIIAAGAVVGLKTYKEVLRNNLIPSLAAGLVIGIAGMIIYFLSL